MKLVILACLLGVSLAYEQITTDYHVDIGIPEAAAIKAGEEATDFNGARIVGGSATSLGQHPHLGGLVITMTTNAQSVCGSSLLTNTRSVTAAHCWRHGNSQARQFVVVHGSLTLFSGGSRTTTTNVQVHASYNMNSLANDIAMIIHGSVGMNNNIRNVPIATGTNTFAGSTAWAAGFGRQSDTQGISTAQRQHHVQLPIITNAVCQQTFGSTIIASTICASGAGGRSTCGGDSGGPLTVNNVLVGVTSFGSAQGCQRGFPAGFARVTSFAAWIQARV